MTTDVELLRSYFETGSEDAFAELVRRRVDLVYSAALRQVNGDRHLAQDVAQTVFSDLARKADSLLRRESLTGWLYTSTHFAAAKAVRTERRRHTYEQEAQVMNELLNAPEPDWTTIAPILDEVMHELDECGREVLLLRYFEKRQLGEIGKVLGVSEDGARKRIERALEKLRACLRRRGITTAAALGTVISINAVQSAPAGLAASLATHSLAGTVTAAGGKLTLWNIMTISKTKLGVAALVAGCMAIPLAIQHGAQAKMRDEIRGLHQQLESAAQDTSPNQAPPGDVAQTTAALTEDDFKELIKLRGEVGTLRRQLQEFGNRRSANDQSTATSQTDRDGGHLATGVFVPLGRLAFAGYATPQAALESVLWAEHQTNVTSYLASLVPDSQQSEQARLQTKFDQGDSQPFFHEGNLVTGFQLLETNAVSADQVALNFFVGGRGGTMKLVTKRIGDEWKLYVGPTF